VFEFNSENLGQLVLLAMATVLGLLATIGVVGLLQPQPVDADSIIGYSTRQLEDGTAGYTTTHYSDAVLCQDFAHLRVQATAPVSATGGVTTTGNITITPQFSIEPVGCGSVTAWFSATAFTVPAGYYTGTTIAVPGRCVRLQYTNAATTTLFTPTTYIQLLNTHD